MAAPSLSASIVTFHPDSRLLERALASLARAVADAREARELGEARLFIVDNGPEAAHGAVLGALASWPPGTGAVEIVRGQGNVGYGRANNLALERARSDVHLVMNPDVELDAQALTEALRALREHPEVGMVAPAVRGEDGAAQYLCRRYPTLWVLFLRGFAPASMRRRHAPALERYEMRDVLSDRFVGDIPIASGCFMLARTELLRRVRGFDPGFFMYFEDYDLSLRIAREARIAYVPQARIVHHGGDAAGKGPRHIGWFVRSAWRFFARHGWRIA